MENRRIVRRPLHDSCQGSGLLKVQILRMLVEVIFGSSFEPVYPVAQKYLVGVEGEDLRLCEAALDLNREHDFMDLPLQMSFRREEEIACQLHRQRRAALRPAVGLHVSKRRANHAPAIDAPM